jgi:E3 ubiquitin-protein ligase HERC1
MEDIPGSSHWVDSYNSSWTREDLYLILNTGGTQYLYEKLSTNGEIEAGSAFPPWTVTARRIPRSRWIVQDKRSFLSLLPTVLNADSAIGFKNDATEEDLEAMASGILDLQVKLGKHLLTKSELAGLINQKMMVFNRLAHAHRVIYQRKIKVPQRDETTILARGSLVSIDGSDRERSGTQALVELGLTTGLALVFALLRQNWQQQQQNPGSNILCNDVLRTALRVLSSLPVLSLANASKMPGDVGQITLNQVTEFLIQSMNPSAIGDDMEGAMLASEVLLIMAVQRGKLSLVLQWINTSLQVKKEPKMMISTEAVRLAVHHIRSVVGGKTFDTSLSEYENALIEQEKAAKLLLSEVVHQSSSQQHSTHNCSDQPPTSQRKSTTLQRNDAYLWGSNSSHQLAEGSQEKIVSPKKSSSFQDVLQMEAGQYCTFVIHDSGHVSGVGKGSYGRLGLGDSTNQSIPRRLSISTPVKAISSSRGSDGHTLALTVDGHVFSWGDGDYGKLGHGNAATQKSPKQVLGSLAGKTVVQVSAGYRHSAAVTADGLLFTWGEGDFGRLGHGDSQFRFVPTLVKDILVGSVTCGAHHTLALSTDEKVVWSFGAGDHGKLGHGDTARHYRPKIVEGLQGLDILKVVAGNQVSMALTKCGEVWAWGSGTCLGLGSAEAASLAPQLIEDFIDIFIVDISIGDSHCLALSQDCTVYAWGVNTMGQCGQGHANSPIVRPVRVKHGLEDVSIHQISAGTSHSMAWTTLPPDKYYYSSF